MTINIAARVKATNDYMAKRLGSSITYARWQSESYDPETGPIKTYFEQPTFIATVLKASETDVDSSSGSVEIGDSKFSFRVDEFTDHSDYEYLSFTSGSTEFTVGEILTGATSGAFGTVVNYYLLGSGGGAWADNDAVGVVWLSGRAGTFEAENLNGSIAGSDCATIAAASTSGGEDNAEPSPNDTILYSGDTWVLDLGSKNLVWRIDISKSMFQIYGRRSS